MSFGELRRSFRDLGSAAPFGVDGSMSASNAAEQVRSA